MNFITHRDFVPYLLNWKEMFGEALEIGTERGAYAELILREWRGSVLHMVDPFITQPMEVYCDVVNTSPFEEFYKTWQRNMARFGERAVLHRKLSSEAVGDFANASLTFIHIDGNHSYANVREDLLLYWPKLKPGGLFSGHDYGDVDRPDYQCGVKKAVDEFARKFGLDLIITPPGWPTDVPSWFIWKP